MSTKLRRFSFTSYVDGQLEHIWDSGQMISVMEYETLKARIEQLEAGLRAVVASMPNGQVSIDIAFLAKKALDGLLVIPLRVTEISMDKPYLGQLRFLRSWLYYPDGDREVRTLQQYLETPQLAEYDGPTTHSWQNVPCVDDSARTSKGVE